MTEGYHYTACGLDYVYLQNGFRVRETSHGRAVSIEDARGLHSAIATMIVTVPDRLRGQDVRFLRAQLKLSQESLAKALRTKRGSVARWELRLTRASQGRPTLRCVCSTRSRLLGIKWQNVLSTFSRKLTSWSIRSPFWIGTKSLRQPGMAGKLWLPRCCPGGSPFWAAARHLAFSPRYIDVTSVGQFSCHRER